MKSAQWWALRYFLEEWDEEDSETFEQVIFKVTNWDDSVVVKPEFEELSRPELVQEIRNKVEAYRNCGP